MLHLAHQNTIKLFHIFFNVALRLLNGLQDAHVLLDHINHIINVLSMFLKQRLFLFENDFDEILVVTADFIKIVGIFDLHILVALQWHLFQWFWHLGSRPIQIVTRNECMLLLLLLVIRLIERLPLLVVKAVWNFRLSGCS